MHAKLGATAIKRIIFAVLFVIAGIYLASIVPSTPVAWVCAILLLTIYLFAFEIVPVDVAAICIMVLLGLMTIIGPKLGIAEPLVPAANLFDGFSSNAVISIIAVMIIGAGLDKTGIMTTVAGFIMQIGGRTEKRIIPLISGTVGIISSFMQNVGAAALFLPVVSRISSRTGLPMSRLLMPMGFCAILGGTVTMIGSSPLILLNDLILTSNQALPADQKMATFNLFSVTPIGLALVATGIIYFVVAGRFVLPVTKEKTGGTEGASTMAYFKELYGLSYGLHEVRVPANSVLIGEAVDKIETKYKIRIMAVRTPSRLRIAPGGLARDVVIEEGNVLAFLASDTAMHDLTEKAGIVPRTDLDTFSNILSPAKAGIAEIVIPPSSNLIGKTARDVWLRKTYGLSALAIQRGGETITEGVRSTPFQSGDTLVVHVPWENLARLEKNRDFVVVTTEYPHEESRPHKVPHALVFFAIALSLILFGKWIFGVEVKLSVALLTGALGMILSGVLSIDEAYRAVSWKTVFLLASLIPLGMAVEGTGTAAWIAEQTLSLLGDVPIWGLQAAVAILATFFTLVMSNVGATVLLVPLAVNIALAAGANPAVFALTVAIATSNSFLIPTHQVNALIMGPAGYRVPDFMKAGGIMTVLFLVVMLVMMNIVF